MEITGEIVMRKKRFNEEQIVRILREAEKAQSTVAEAWTAFGLDTDYDSNVHKPHSLYIEALKQMD